MDINLKFDTWNRAKTPKHMNDVLQSMSGDIDRSIRTAGGQPSPLLRGHGRLAVVKAMSSFDPKAGTQFRSWAQSQLRGLVRPVRASRFAVKIPELRAREASRIRNVIESRQAETGFEPSDAVIADQLGLPISRVSAVRGGEAPEVVSGEIFFKEAPADDNGLIQDMVYYSLPPRDQTIMEYGLGYNNVKPMPSTEIAKKLKITPSAVSQRLSKIRKMMIDAEGE